MNHLFGEYIGIFMDVYLDDIIIYSDMLEEHLDHVCIVIGILECEQLFLSEKKLKFLSPVMHILGRVVSDDGIRMDPDKVDKVLNWKAPTNHDLCRGFIGAVGYLADDIYKVRIPMGVLSAVCRDMVPFRWAEHQENVTLLFLVILANRILYMQIVHLELSERLKTSPPFYSTLYDI